jgi:serine phosphatase RsbU (regulator of sigma subunit)
MTEARPYNDDAGKSPEQSMSRSCCLRLGLSRTGIRFSALWRQMKQLGVWLESEALPSARSIGQEQVVVVYDPAPGPEQGFRVRGRPGRLEGARRLMTFLDCLGIEELVLDVRLERNQITDILTLLYAWRRRLWRGVVSSAREIGYLHSETGLHVCCTQTRLDGPRLHVAYSYCMTRFSRMVAWFEKRHRIFGDHRALFFAAPRYAALAGIFAAVPFTFYAFHGNWWILLGVTAFGAIAAFAVVYLFLMAMGSVEYDNEEKAYRLSVAYGKLQRYADHIRDDLSQARTVQESLLPDGAHMPLPDRLQWAWSFKPMAEVGGDYFDVAALAGGRIAVFFADVSGHGMSAALVTAILKTAFAGWQENSMPIEEYASHLNRLLCRVTPVESFAAAMIATYDGDSGELEYINCGHNPEPLWLPAKADEETCFLSEGNAIILGVEEDMSFVPVRKILRPGDTVMCATDGLIEAMDPDGAMYTSARLLSYATANRNAEPQQLVDGLVSEVTAFARGVRQGDDRMILVMRAR